MGFRDSTHSLSFLPPSPLYLYLRISQESTFFFLVLSDAKVCCPGFDDALSTAVRKALTQGADTGLLDYLVLETSGAADPRRIVGALEEPRCVQDVSNACWDSNGYPLVMTNIAIENGHL